MVGVNEDAQNVLPSKSTFGWTPATFP
jgi:hypothetical protein